MYIKVPKGIWWYMKVYRGIMEMAVYVGMLVYDRIWKYMIVYRGIGEVAGNGARRREAN